MPQEGGAPSAARRVQRQTTSNSACAVTWRKLVCIAALMLVSARVMRAPAAKLGGSSAKGGYPAAVRETVSTGGGDPAAPPPALAQSSGGHGPSAVARVEPVLERAGSPSPEDRNNSSAALSFVEEGRQADKCSPCEAWFRNLEGAEQHVSVVLRGEPKSGTSFMYEWAVNALMVTCSHLELLYGKGACQVSWRRMFSRDRPSPITAETPVVKMKEVFFVFEPSRNRRGRDSMARSNSPANPQSSARCSCENVNRVSVTLSSLYKHDLPVSKECPWQHADDVSPEGKGCTSVAGQPVQNYTDTVRCLHENPCRITDSRHQMLILRDPRAVVVSSFFHQRTHPESAGRARPGESVEGYALRLLPTICRFVHLRYQLLQEKLLDRTVEFLYDESFGDPSGWHRRWLSFVGFTPPDSVAQEATDLSQRREFGFTAKGIDKHPGGTEATQRKSWQDEISAEVLGQMHEICRLWLPPVLLDKFGIEAPP